MSTLTERKMHFISKSNEIHHNKYDYTKVEYVNAKTKVCIICPDHGGFWQEPTSHISKKYGCPKCGGTSKYSESEFIHKASKLHKNKYDYSKVEYLNISTQICITCPKHGEFFQLPSNHIRGAGCIKCRIDNTKSNIESFIQRANDRYEFLYDYSKVKYKNNKTKVCIICPEHGEFWQRPDNHLFGNGHCFKCSQGKRHESLKLPISTFIKESSKIHNNQFDYSKVSYKTVNDKVCIICPKHGEFWQRAADHKQGIGCPFCVESKGEKKITEALTSLNINYTTQKTFKGCVHINKLPFDFFIPTKNLLIEYDGEQHFNPVKYFGGLKAYLKLKKRDKIKTEFSESNGIKLLRIPYWDISKIDEVLTANLNTKPNTADQQ